MSFGILLCEFSALFIHVLRGASGEVDSLVIRRNSTSGLTTWGPQRRRSTT